MLVVITWIICAIAGGKIGAKKGHMTAGVLLGLILGPIGLIIVLIMGTNDDRALEQGGVRRCPYCAEQVKAEAIVCKHCGRDLPGTKRTIRPSL